MKTLIERRDALKHKFINDVNGLSQTVLSPGGCFEIGWDKCREEMMKDVHGLVDEANRITKAAMLIEPVVGATNFHHPVAMPLVAFQRLSQALRDFEERMK